MIKRIVRRPLTWITALAAAALLQLFLTVVSAQSPNPAPTPIPPIESARELFGILSSMVVGVSAVVAVVYWAFWGRDKQQIKDDRDGWKSMAERLRTELADAKTSITEMRAERLELKEQVEELRTLNLRLQKDEK
jgi:hypothetical protein